MAIGIAMSDTLFELLCTQAAAGRIIKLPAGGLVATFKQAENIAREMRPPGELWLSRDNFDGQQQIFLTLLGCRWNGKENP